MPYTQKARFSVKTATLLGLATLAALGLAARPAGAQALTVTDSTDGTSLANALLGSGVTLVGTPTLVGQSGSGGAQQGLFNTTGGGSIVGFDSGVLFTTGYAHNAIGPNNATLISQAWSSAGDADMTALAGVATHDANSLTFSFTVNPGTSNLGLQYALGSDEYNEFVGSYNDQFGFYVDGTNVAKLPGTGDTVSIGNVNLNKNSSYFIDNTDGHLNTQYDGLTKPLYADVSAALDPSLTVHTIKIVIADAGDTSGDSGVFIRGSSLGQGGNGVSAVPEPSSVAAFALTGLGAAGLMLRARKRRASAA